MDRSDVQAMMDIWQGFFSALGAFAPRLLSGLLLLLVGFVLAHGARRATAWGVRRARIDALLERVGVSRLLYGVGLRTGVPESLGQIAWMVVVLVALVSAAEAIGLPGVAEGLAAVVAYVPRLMAAVIVMVAGAVAADFLRSLVHRAGAERVGLEAPEVVARLVWVTVMTVAATLAAEHLGVRTGLIEGLVLITGGGVVLAAALAFALGGRPIFTGLLARRYCEQAFQVGDRIELGDVRGELESFGGATAWLRDAEGGLLGVPCERLIREVVRVSPSEPEGDGEREDTASR